MTLLRLITEQRLLMENKAQVDQMVNSFPFDVLHRYGVPEKDARSFFDSQYRTAKQQLKRKDRIIWYINYTRIILSTIFAVDEKGNLTEHAPKFLRRWVGKYQSHADSHVIAELRTFHRLIVKNRSPSEFIRAASNKMQEVIIAAEHFVAIAEQGATEIDNIDWAADTPWAILELQFKPIVKKWEANRRRIAKASDEDLAAERLIEFPDGYMWIKLDRAACSVEGNAMGHCGNIPRSDTNDRIISLRKYNPSKNEFTYAATFILEDDGYFGERKGANNNKPDPKYHPYIVEMLKLDFYKGFKKGRWGTSGDFQINDLRIELKEDLFNHRPDMFNFKQYVEIRSNGSLRKTVYEAGLEYLNLSDRNIVTKDEIGDMDISSSEYRALKIRCFQNVSNHPIYYNFADIKRHAYPTDKDLRDYLKDINKLEGLYTEEEIRAIMKDAYRKGYQTYAFVMKEIGAIYGWDSEEFIGQMKPKPFLTSTDFRKWAMKPEEAIEFLNDAVLQHYIDRGYGYMINHLDLLMERANGDKNNVHVKAWLEENSHEGEMRPCDWLALEGADSVQYKNSIKEAFDSLDEIKIEDKSYVRIQTLSLSDFSKYAFNEKAQYLIENIDDWGFDNYYDFASDNYLYSVGEDKHKDIMVWVIENNYSDEFKEEFTGSPKDENPRHLLEFLLSNSDLFKDAYNRAVNDGYTYGANSEARDAIYGALNEWKSKLYIYNHDYGGNKIFEPDIRIAFTENNKTTHNASLFADIEVIVSKEDMLTVFNSKFDNTDGTGISDIYDVLYDWANNIDSSSIYLPENNVSDDDVIKSVFDDEMFEVKSGYGYKS